MLFLDKADETEESLNNYYKYIYQPDDKQFSDARLNDLAAAIASYVKPDAPIMDIGGMDQELAKRLIDRGLTDISVSGPGNDFKRDYQVFILSHTLEHVYNINGLLGKIKAHIKPGGLVFVEVPIWADDSPITYDFHWQHCNKFTPNHMMILFERFGFTVIESIPMADYREYHCWRMVARHD